MFAGVLARSKWAGMHSDRDPGRTGAGEEAGMHEAGRGRATDGPCKEGRAPHRYYGRYLVPACALIGTAVAPLRGPHSCTLAVPLCSVAGRWRDTLRQVCIFGPSVA